MSISYRMVFSYYVMNEVTPIHQIHLKLLNMYNYIFDKIDFILAVDDLNDQELIDNTIDTIKGSITNPHLNIIIEQNDHDLREGHIYYKYVISRLQEFIDNNELVFFGHTKGVTNHVNIEQYENTKNWIGLMYWENLGFMHMVYNQLITNEKVSWGSIYIYDDSNTTTYHWQYCGAFYWINPKLLLNRLIENHYDYDILPFLQKKCIAEELLGYNVDVDDISFLNSEKINKRYSPLLYEDSTYGYYNIIYPALLLLNVNYAYQAYDFLQNI